MSGIGMGWSWRDLASTYVLCCHCVPNFRRWGWIGDWRFGDDFVCYTLSRPKTCQVFGDCTMGSGTSASSVILSICSICHYDYSIYSSIPEFCSPLHFMSELRFVSCFHFTSHFHSPCSIFIPQTPTLIYA